MTDDQWRELEGRRLAEEYAGILMRARGLNPDSEPLIWRFIVDSYREFARKVPPDELKALAEKLKRER